jgi:hypothetical protein
LLLKQDSNNKPATGSCALVSNNTAASSTDDKAFVVDSDGIGHGNSSAESSPVAKLLRCNANNNAKDIVTYPLANMPSAEYSGHEVAMKPMHDACGSVGNVNLPPPQAKWPRSDSRICDALVPSFGAQVCGRAVAGKANLLIQSLYVDNLSQHQHEMMYNAYWMLMSTDGTQLSMPELVRRIANLWDS